MTVLNDALLRAGVWLAENTPAPDTGSTVDANLVTPGVVGFVVTLLVALATVFLLVDMNRRIRRTRYREEVRMQLEAEQAAADGSETGTPAPTA